MTKWADYVITKVKFRDEGTHILAVKARQDTGEHLSVEKEWSRQQVVSAIEKGTSFVTAVKKDTGWKKGEDVHIVIIHATRYIRTDKNPIKKDNLGELPEY